MEYTQTEIRLSEWLKTKCWMYLKNRTYVYSQVDLNPLYTSDKRTEKLFFPQSFMQKYHMIKNIFLGGQTWKVTTMVVRILPLRR